MHVDTESGGAGAVVLDEVCRFLTPIVPGPAGSLVWDIESLRGHVRRGIIDAASRALVRSVAIDSWAVDYGLLDSDGRLIGPVHSYRSARTDGVMAEVCDRVGREHIYDVTGIQFLPFNTLYQLVAASGTAAYTSATRLLMVPDVLNHDLCGSTTNDVTNASTTQLLDARTGEWSDPLIAELGLRRDLMPQLHQPGARLGQLVGVDATVDGIDVIAAASHDTASAVLGTPLRADLPGIYISCGTWSLVGCELSAPVINDEALAANVTNERGAGRTTRLLKNVSGLWLLEQARQGWAAAGVTTDVAALLAAAADVPAGRSVINPDDLRFAAAGPIAARIADACRESGQPVPAEPAEVARVIFDSLALAWRRTVRTMERVAGFDADVIHLVGGGSANALLAELCASACERLVLVGPVEATVVGNMLVQAIADGLLPDVAGGRALIERALPPRTVLPTTTVDWDALERRLMEAGQLP